MNAMIDDLHRRIHNLKMNDTVQHIILALYDLNKIEHLENILKSPWNQYVASLEIESSSLTDSYFSYFVNDTDSLNIKLHKYKYLLTRLQSLSPEIKRKVGRCRGGIKFVEQIESFLETYMVNAILQPIDENEQSEIDYWWDLC